jgi:integrase/recombinase XerD
MWDPYKKGFKAYLQLERSLSDNSVEAYMRDIEKLTEYLQHSGTLKNPSELKLTDLQAFHQVDRRTGNVPDITGTDHFRYKIIL